MSSQHPHSGPPDKRGEPLFPQPPQRREEPLPGGSANPSASGRRAKPPGPPPPHDVQTAFQLWLAVIALGVLIVPLRIVGMALNIDDTTDMFMNQIEQQPALDMTYEQARVWSYVAVGVAGLLLLSLLGIVLAIAYAMRRGKQWARIALTAIAVFLVVFAVPAIFGGAGTGWVAFFDSALGIVQAVLAAGSIVLMHREEPNQYFARGKNGTH